MNKSKPVLGVKERLKVYARAYLIIESGKFEFSCRAIGGRYWTNDEYMFDNFPEFMLCGPYYFKDSVEFGSSGVWFAGTKEETINQRLTMLAFCMAMCKS